MHLLMLINFIGNVPISGDTSEVSLQSVYSIVGIAILVSTLLGGGLSFLVQNWVNKRKIPAEVSNLNAETDVRRGDVAETFQKISAITANENLDLVRKNTSLQKDIEKLRCELLASDEANKKALEKMDRDNKEALSSIKSILEAAIDRGDKFEDWARRLVLELHAWNIEPVPFDVEEAKDIKIQERKAQNDSEFMNKDHK